MAIIKKKTRKKLSKQLTKLVKKHGAETAITLVTGIVGAMAAHATAESEPRAKLKRVKSSVADR